MNRKILFSVLLLFISIGAYAQNITNYVFDKNITTSNWVSNSSATLINLNPLITLELGGVDDAVSAVTPIGFNFTYMGQSYSKFSVSSNGWLTLGDAVIANSLPANSLSGHNLNQPILAPLWDDLSLYSLAGLGLLLSGNVTYEVKGTSSKYLLVEWNLMRWYKDANAGLLGPVLGAASNISFQIKLYENGKIEYIYGDVPTSAVNSGAKTASVGITYGAPGATRQYRSVNKIDGAATGITSSSTSEISTISVLPSNGLLLSFTAPPVATPTNLTFTNVGVGTMKLNWVDAANDELGYRIYRSTNNSTFTLLTSLPANSVTFTDTGLTASTIYYYRVEAYKEVGVYVSGSQTTQPPCDSSFANSINPAYFVANFKLNGNAQNAIAGSTNTGTLRGAPSFTSDNWGVANSAVLLNGTSNYVTSSTGYNGASIGNFSISVWFKTSTTQGGLLVGLNSSPVETVSGEVGDRHLYVGVDGKVYFGTYGVYNSTYSVKTIKSTNVLNDGVWHLATATFSTTSGSNLYIDGILNSTDATMTAANSFFGYWRMGAQNFNAMWPSKPTSNYFNGALDDVYISNTVLGATTVPIASFYQSPNGITNSSPNCVGESISLEGPSIEGATYLWSGPNNFSSTLRNPTVVLSAQTIGVYTLTVGKVDCFSTVYTRVSLYNDADGKWTGKVSADWATAANWCNGVVPSSITNVTIPTIGPINNPVISTVAPTNNVSVQAARILKVQGNGDLQVKGAITNTGVLDVSMGKVTYNGTLAQALTADLFKDNTIKHLTISNAAGLNLLGPITMLGVLRITDGNLTNNNNLITLKASETATAAVASLPSGSAINGLVKVETFHKGGAKAQYRGYRMFSSPVYDNVASFVNNDVEGNRSAKFSQLIDNTIISGIGGVGNGFDNTPNNLASAWTYNNIDTKAYAAIPNISTAVNAGKVMYIYYRGSRSDFGGKTNFPYVDVDDNIVDYIGVLNQQNVSVALNYSVDNPFVLLGNPYAATLDWDSPSLVKTATDGTVWAWNDATRNYATYKNNIGTNGGSKYIASGRGFFVKANSTGLFTFTENAKYIANDVVGNEAQSVVNPKAMPIMFNEKAFTVTPNLVNDRSIIRMVLNEVSSFGQDEAVLVFTSSANANATEEDAIHLNGERVNLSTLSSDKMQLAINFMPKIDNSGTINLSVSASETGNYNIQFNLSEFYENQDVRLVDSYLNTTTLLSSGTIYSFNIAKQTPASFGDNRFSLVFEKRSVLAMASGSFKAQKSNTNINLTWKVSGASDISSFKVYKAVADGKLAWLANVQLQDGKLLYTYLDAYPQKGVNYYKLTQIDVLGVEKELGLSGVDFGIDAINNALIYPNPVVDFFTVESSILKEGKYRLEITEVNGKKWKTVNVSNQEIAEGYKVDASAFKRGVYLVKVVSKQTGEILITEKIVK